MSGIFDLANLQRGYDRTHDGRRIAHDRPVVPGIREYRGIRAVGDLRDVDQGT